MKKFYSLFIFLTTLIVNCKNLEAYLYDISIAAIFRNEAPYLKEWIDYHHMIGVNHFWLYDDTSTDQWKEVLQPYIDQGIVNVIDWSEYRKAGVPWPEPQKKAYRHALKNALGKSQWVALIDIDEFILPMADSSLTDCLKNHFSQFSAIYVTWRHFGTGGVFLNPGDSILFNLTSCSSKTHYRNSVGKSILRPEEMKIEKLWFAHHCPLKKGGRYSDGEGNEIPHAENDVSNPHHHDKYIRINHYFFRGENEFQKKLAWKIKRGWKEQEMREQYRDFSLEKDFSIIDFIKKNYQDSIKRTG